MVELGALDRILLKYITTLPFQALYGKPPPCLVRFGNGKIDVDSLTQLLQGHDLVLDEFQFNLVKV